MKEHRIALRSCSWTAGLMLIAALLAGCEDAPEPEPAGQGELSVTFEVTQTSPHLLVATRMDAGGGDAQVIGQLEYLPGPDCFVIDGFGDDMYRLALAWPPGTTASAEGGGVLVTVPGFGDIRAGEWLLGAGYYPHPDRGMPAQPAECSPSETEFAVRYDVTKAGPEPLLEN